MVLGQWVEGNINKCSQGPYRSGAFCPRAFQQYLVYRRNFNWPHGCVYRLRYIIIWGRGDRGFWLCDVASLMMYCIDGVDSHQRIVWQNPSTWLLSLFYTQWLYYRRWGSLRTLLRIWYRYESTIIFLQVSVNQRSGFSHEVCHRY